MGELVALLSLRDREERARRQEREERRDKKERRERRAGEPTYRIKEKGQYKSNMPAYYAFSDKDDGRLLSEKAETNAQRDTIKGTLDRGHRN